MSRADGPRSGTYPAGPGDGGPPMTAGGWLVRRILPAVVLVTAGGVAAGFFRGLGLFLPGLTGMAAGLVLGWLAGRPARNDPGEDGGFGARAGLALGAGLLFETAAALTVSALFARTGEGPLEWLHGVLSGYRGELFLGVSRGSLQSVSGRLEGGAWIFFVLVDLLLFAFLFLIGHGVASSPPDDDEESAGDEAWADPEPPEIPGQPAGFRPRGTVAFALLTAVAVAAVVVPPRLWPDVYRARPEALSSTAAAGLTGSWVFGPGAPFLGPDDAHRTFTLSTTSYGPLMGRASGSGTFLMSLTPAANGGFWGTLFLGKDRSTRLSVHMQPSPDRRELRFTLFQLEGTALRRTMLLAHRPEAPE
ncbi:MAG TPA: hypothetical protein ENK19_08690 [Acidobacteria bacterium]|nr:hypothetical protein [Acidobacteriota bacterium]